MTAPSVPRFEFDRYINGNLMAEGVTVERQADLTGAMGVAARIASKGPNGETPVLVLRATPPAPTPSAARERIARIIDPHSFLDIPFTDDPVLLGMVEDSKRDALRKADAILPLLPDASAIRAAAFEEAAKIAEGPAGGWNNTGYGRSVSSRLASAIRAAGEK